MKIFISVVSHGHQNLLSKLGCLEVLIQNSNVEVIVKNNISVDLSCLKGMSVNDNFHIIDESYGLGFGDNNNYTFKWCKEKLRMKDDDWFLVLNPDVFIDSNSLQQIVELSDKNSHQLTTVNLYKDSAYLSFDNCVRLFPSFFDFLFSFLGFKNKTIVDKSNSDSVNCVDWAAGSFLLFKSKLYNDLGGFDPNYFMYCEDIDICWRAQKLQEKFLFFYSEIKAIHYAQHANRSLLSIHFVWHIKSILRYILITNRLIKPYKDKL